MNKSYSKIKLGFDRLLSKSLLRQFVFLGLVLLFALFLSYGLLAISYDDWQGFCYNHHLSMWLLPLYLLIDSNALNNIYIYNSGGYEVHLGMLIASTLTFLLGMFIFNGMIISMLTNAIEQRVRKHREGNLHYLKSGHYIIMGYDDMVPSIITHISDKDKDAYVLLLTSAKPMEIREKLMKSFPQKQMERIIINYGHRVSADAYKDIHLETAEHVYVVGNHEKPAHDAINVECIDSICRYLNTPGIIQKPSRIVCVFKDLDTYAALKTSEIFKHMKDFDIEFIPYNYYTGWAKQVFVNRKYKDFDNPGKEYDYPAVFGKGITPDDNKPVHLVFVGTTNFAVAFAMEAAHVLHFPNADKAKTRITFIDKNADKEKDEFITRNRYFFEVQAYTYRDLSYGKEKEKEGIRDEYVRFKDNEANFLDVEFEFIKGDVFSKAVQDEIAKWAGEHNEKQYLSIFLALADQRQNFVMGMNMPEGVYDNEVPIFIRQDRSDNFVTNLRNADKRTEGEKLIYSFVNGGGTLDQKEMDARYANIYPFGMNETAYCADDRSLKRAKLINYLYATTNFQTYKFKDLLALKAIHVDKICAEADNYWKELTVANKWSNLYSAYTIQTKLAILRAMRGLDIQDKSHDYDTLTDKEVEILARVEHNRWNVEKLLMGFRKALPQEDKYAYPEYADKLIDNKKRFIHHDIRPFEDLDIIKGLDCEFSRYIPWIMRMTED